MPTYEQSSVIPYRFQKGQLEFLLVTTRRGRWIVPKGLVDPGFTPPEAAAQEAFEEAGVKGKVDPEVIGRYIYHKWGGRCDVEMYLMEVTKVLDTWQEDTFRERKWMSPEQAQQKVRKPKLRDLLKKAEAILQGKKR